VDYNVRMIVRSFNKIQYLAMWKVAI